MKQRFWNGFPFWSAILSAVLLSLCFLPFGVWNVGRAGLAWVALTPLYLALRETRQPKNAFFLGYLFGLVLHLFGGYWLTEIGFVPYLCVALIMSLWFGLFAAVFVVGNGQRVAGSRQQARGNEDSGKREERSENSQYLPPSPPTLSWGYPPARWGRAISRRRRSPNTQHLPLFVGTRLRDGAVQYLLFSLLWVVLEWARTLGDYAFPWFPLAATQTGVPPMLQTLEYTGQWGVGFCIALVSALVGEVVAERKKGRLLIGVVLLPALLFGQGVAAIAAREKRDTKRAVVQAAAIQGVYTGGNSDTSLGLYLDLSRQAVAATASGSLDIVVWPETVVWDNTYRGGYSRTDIGLFAASAQTAVLAGVSDSDPENRRYNSAVLFKRDGQIAGKYDKIRIVPLGEFFPLRNIFGPIYAKYPVGQEDLIPGTRPGVFTVKNVSADKQAFRVGTLICYESAFGGRARQEVQNGAEFLCVMTNDFWFGMTAGPLQHADLSSLRAIETRRGIVRAATSGESRIIDATGRVLAKLPLMERGQIQSAIMPNTETTVYVRYGNWFVAFCGVLGFGFWVLGFRYWVLGIRF